MEKRKIILITGCGGMLGEAVYKQFKDRYQVYATDIDLNEPWLSHLDVSDDKQVQEYGCKIRPDFIIHLAALTDMEYCELHLEETYNINTHGTENMVNLALELNIPLVYISTAGIFDGSKEQYNEDDDPLSPAPLSIYGKSKYQGEIAARNYPKSTIIRAGWMMGGGPRKDKKFVNKIIKQLHNEPSEIAVVDDKLGTPTYTYDLAKIIARLLEDKRYGLYHGVCDGGGSRYDVAVYILECLGLKNRVTIRVVSSDYFKNTYFAPRPASEQLGNQKIKNIDPTLIHHWRGCLKDYLERFNWMSASET